MWDVPLHLGALHIRLCLLLISDIPFSWWNLKLHVASGCREMQTQRRVSRIILNIGLQQLQRRRDGRWVKQLMGAENHEDALDIPPENLWIFISGKGLRNSKRHLTLVPQRSQSSSSGCLSYQWECFIPPCWFPVLQIINEQKRPCSVPAAVWSFYSSTLITAGSFIM